MNTTDRPGPHPGESSTDTAVLGGTASPSDTAGPIDIDGLPGCPTCEQRLLYIEDATTWARYDIVRLDDGTLAYDVDTQRLDWECEFDNGRLQCPTCASSWPADHLVEI